MSLLITPGASGMVEVDIATLDEDEHFFIAMFRGGDPEGTFEQKLEMRKKLAAMKPEDIRARSQRGLDSLMAKGLFDYVRDENGTPIRDDEGDFVYRRVGRLISRMTLSKVRH